MPSFGFLNGWKRKRRTETKWRGSDCTENKESTAECAIAFDSRDASANSSDCEELRWMLQWYVSVTSSPLLFCMQAWWWWITAIIIIMANTNASLSPALLQRTRFLPDAHVHARTQRTIRVGFIVCPICFFFSFCFIFGSCSIVSKLNIGNEIRQFLGLD